MKEIFLVNTLLMKKHQVKLKQTWIAETRFNVLNYQIQRDSDEDIVFLLLLEINDKRNVCVNFQKGIFQRSRGRELKTFSLATLVCSNPPFFRVDDALNL